MERKEPTIGPIAFTETEGQSIEPSRRRTLKPRRPAVAALLGLPLPAAALAYVGHPFAVLLLHFGLIAALAALGWSGCRGGGNGGQSRTITESECLLSAGGRWAGLMEAQRPSLCSTAS